MNKSRARLILALLFLVLSIAALAWGFFPGERSMLHEKIAPTEMQVPTPKSDLPLQPNPRLTVVNSLIIVI